MKLGTQTGNLFSHLMTSGDHSLLPLPSVGDAATICYWTDRHAGTVTKVTPGKRPKVEVTEDTATRVDKNGMSDSQDYEFARNPDGKVHKFYRTKYGQWAEVGTGGKGKGLSLGHRSHYYDFSF